MSILLMEPLLPSVLRADLAAKTQKVFYLAGLLEGKMTSEYTRDVLCGLLEKMNSYYSNLIEGNKTRLQDIDAAFERDFSKDPKNKNYQLLAIAHIETEREVKKWLQEGRSPYSEDFLKEIHKGFYSRLPEQARMYEGVSGAAYQLIPGEIRDHVAVVGSHVTLEPQNVSNTLKDFFAFYKSERILATNRLVSIAASHHRLAWIHPFPDGNGRVSRLFTQACLIYHGYSSATIWSISRAFARKREAYYHHLHQADQLRRHDTDGRGNLSDAALAEFCTFTLDLMIDQIEFMIKLLDIESIGKNYRRLAEDHPLLRDHAEEYGRVGLLLFRKGKIERSEVAQEMGCSHATATDRIKKLLESGIASTPSEKGNLFLNFPESVVSRILPRLYDTMI